MEMALKPPHESAQQRHNQMHASLMTSQIVRLRLSGGHRLEVFARVLCREPGSTFAALVTSQPVPLIIDCAHRDDRLVRLLVNCMRHCLDEGGHATRKFVPPEQFDAWRALIAEAQYWRLATVEQLVRDANCYTANTIVIGYHGTLAVGRGAFTSDVNFRKIDRIIVSGKARACREVFGRFLNETRDWNMDTARYTTRFYLIHPFLEQAFDVLATHRYALVSSSSTTPRFVATAGAAGAKSSNSNFHDERNFAHYSQYVFVRTS